MRGRVSLGLLLALAAPVPAVEPGLKAGGGTFKVECKDDEKCGVAERYRMPACEVEYKLTPRHER